MNSLAVRLFFSATVWIILTLLAAGLLLSDLNKKSNFAAFDDRLNLLLETLIGASRVDSSDSITVVSSIEIQDSFNLIQGGIGKLIMVQKHLVDLDQCGIKFLLLIKD